LKTEDIRAIVIQAGFPENVFDKWLKEHDQHTPCVDLQKQLMTLNYIWRIKMYTDEAVEKLLASFEVERKMLHTLAKKFPGPGYDLQLTQAMITTNILERWAADNRLSPTLDETTIRDLDVDPESVPKLVDALARIATLETTLATITPHIEEIVRALAVYER
jgi:hypothetical protein